MTGTVNPAKKRDRLRRLRNLFSHSSPVVANQTEPSSATSHSASASIPILSKPKPSTPSVARSSSSCSRLSLDLGGRPAPQCLTATTALGRDCLDRALQLLPQQERKTIEEHVLSTADDIDSVLRDAYKAAQEKQQVCEDNRWTFTFGRHIVRLRDEADKVLLWLDRFKQVGDIAVNADPIHAGLPWAGVRLLLEAAVSESRQMATLLVGLKTALYMMNRLKAYMDYLRDLPGTSTRTNFEKSLTEFHALILQFLARAIQVYQESALTRTFNAFWKSEEVQAFENKCDKIGARVEIEASNCDRTLSALGREEANKRKEGLGRVLKELQGLQDIKESVSMLQTQIDLAKLPTAPGAAFDSHLDELDAICHPETRIDLLRQIREWARDPQGKSIFWLNGMAGTGKSTISRSAAQSFARDGQLGASFFFKRGEGDRGNASRFFTTLTAQLVYKAPAVIPYVRKAIEADPAISEKSMKEQFEMLIFRPMSEMGRAVTPILNLVIVIDALDECEREGDIRNILHLLSQTQHLRSVCVRIFLTSRPDLPVRLGFRRMSADAHQDVILQDIPLATIEHDISAFLRDEFVKIRDDYNCSHAPDSSPPSEWPNEKNIDTLTKMANPLFIFAATVSRFVGDHRWDPEERLATVLKYQATSQASKLDRTYLPILDQLLIGLTSSEKERLAQEFREIVGSIAILADPLSISSLARLLDIPKKTIDCRLDSLHSVLSIPLKQDSPVRLLHLSFREFLVDIEKRGKSPFWVNERETHKTIATKCLELMSRSECLRENICNLETPGKLRSKIDSRTIDDSLPTDIRYACQHWVHHLMHSQSRIRDRDQVHVFLQKYFLYWLEALSLMGKISESITLINNLQSLVLIDESTEVSDFLYDGKRFVLQNRWIIDIAPLQLYSSAMIFAPKASIIRNIFKKHIPRWICRLPEVLSAWSPELQKFEGHTDSVNAVAFSPDGQLLASASGDGTVRLWNPATGEQQQQLESHTDSVNAVAFSPDGQLLASASASGDGTVRLWNPATGEEKQKSKLNTVVSILSFSIDNKHLQTNRGVLHLYSSLESPFSIELKCAGDIFLNGNWICRNNQNFLWLPHDYRGQCSAVKNNVLVIGQVSGQVTFMEFSLF